MKQGFSFESFGAEIGVHRDTLYEWVVKHAAFSDAKKLGTLHSMKHWEHEGMRGMWKGKAFNAAVWIFNMRNRFGWTDKVEADVEEGERRFVFIEGGKRVS